MPDPTHIAVLDDEADITAMICDYAASHGFRTSALQCGDELFELMARDAPALVLLDLGLPGEDGLAIARTLRERWRCGLIIVTGRGDSVDKVVGLELGADDYVTKPFVLRELIARARAVLRRLETAPPPATVTEVLNFEGWTLELDARRLVHPEGHEVTLTTGEFDLLAILTQSAGRVLSRDYLLDKTRGRQAAPFDRTIDVQIARLRKKMEADAENPRLIKSVRGAGYVFVPKVQSA